MASRLILLLTLIMKIIRN